MGAGAASAPASPFICALGRWTPHLISNQGDFSIFLLSTVRLQIWDFFITSFFLKNYTWAPFFVLDFSTLFPSLLRCCFLISTTKIFLSGVYLIGSVPSSSPPPLPLPPVCVPPPLPPLLPPPAPSLHQPEALCSPLDLLSFFVGEASMGAQFSKTAAKGEATTERPGEAAVASSPSKANGQVNSTCGSGHLFGVFL